MPPGPCSSSPEEISKALREPLKILVSGGEQDRLDLFSRIVEKAEEGKVDSDVLNDLATLATGWPWDGTKEELIEVLAGAQRAEFAPLIVHFFNDPDAAVRNAALQALSNDAVPLYLDDIADLLKDRSAPIRQIAALSLGAGGGPDQCPRLKALLKDSSEGVRATAVWALAKLGDQSVAPEVKKLLTGKGNKKAVSEGLYAARRLSLLDLGTAAVPHLRQKSEEVRLEAVMTLDSLRVRCAPKLKPLLQDKDYEVRAMVLVALSRYPAEEVEKEIYDCLLKDRNLAVRFGALRALGALRAGRHSKELFHFILERHEEDSSDALEAIGLMGDAWPEDTRPSVVSYVERQLENVEEGPAYEDPDIEEVHQDLIPRRKLTACAALARLGVAGSVDRGLGILKDLSDPDRHLEFFEAVASVRIRKDWEAFISERLLEIDVARLADVKSVVEKRGFSLQTRENDFELDIIDEPLAEFYRKGLPRSLRDLMLRACYTGPEDLAYALCPGRKLVLTGWEEARRLWVKTIAI